jgi:tRNA threonylcarbamoyladenosine biosynthesis protein TsaE
VEPLEPVRRTRTTDSPEATRALGATLGEVLREGDFVGLSGQLGAGKTVFARGVAEGAGVDGADVSSPSYSIVQTYRGRITLHHADLYRLQGEDDLYATGYHELLSGPGALLVEWFDRIPGAVPEDALLIHLELVGLEGRRLSVAARGPVSEATLVRWEQRLPDGTGGR